MIDAFDKYRQFASAIGGYYEELMQELILVLSPPSPMCSNKHA